MKIKSSPSFSFLLAISVVTLLATKSLAFKAFQQRNNIADVPYDIEQSKQFQKYSIITHCNQQLLEKWTCKLCDQMTELQDREYVINNVTNIMALLGYHPKLNAIVMIFRGTEDIRNWIEDFTYAKADYARCVGCKVHEGFYFSYLSICLQINKYIEKIRLKYPDSKIYSIGASLGGSLATIAALEIQLIYGGVQQLHVFGCPRTGNVNYVKFLASKVSSIRRVIHNRDIVPHVPLISQDYYHAPYQILFDAQMKQYRICNDTGQDSSCSNAFYPAFNILDHISYWVTPDVTKICKD